MWLFLSKRVRTWVLLSVALPVVATLVGKVAARARAHDPSSTTARTLTRADRTLSSLARRRKGSARVG